MEDVFGKYGVKAYRAELREDNVRTIASVHVHATGSFSLAIESFSGLGFAFTTYLTPEFARKIAQALMDGADLHEQTQSQKCEVAL